MRRGRRTARGRRLWVPGVAVAMLVGLLWGVPPTGAAARSPVASSPGPGIGSRPGGRGHRLPRLIRVSPRIPIGAHPAAGRSAPRVLTPAQELADVGPLPPGWGASVHVLDSGGLTRNYLVLAPSAPGLRAHSLRLYVVLHGRGSNPARFERLTSLPAETGPAVLVYPAGYEDSWNAGACCGYAHADGVDDVGFLHRVVAQVLATEPAVSSHEVYVIGFSNGGRMAFRLACDLPGTFAGVAAVEAVPVLGCARLQPLDVEIVAQARDPLLQITAAAPARMTDGYLEPSVQATVGRWRALDGCAPPPDVRVAGDATSDTWACRDGTRLQYTLYRGGAHVWPVGRPGQPSADRVILSFLS